MRSSVLNISCSQHSSNVVWKGFRATAHNSFFQRIVEKLFWFRMSNQRRTFPTSWYKKRQATFARHLLQNIRNYTISKKIQFLRWGNLLDWMDFDIQKSRIYCKRRRLHSEKRKSLLNPFIYKLFKAPFVRACLAPNKESWVARD